MDKDLLFKPRLEERDVELSIGTVRVRAMTRAEATRFKGEHEDVGKLERQMLAVALVDPVLTEDEVGRWQDAAPAGELQDVVDVVVELSGMLKETGKTNQHQFR